MRKILALAWAIGVFGMAGVALAQTALPDGVTEEQMNAAFKDLSAVYGAPVVRLDQAKAICNEEKYVTDCAQIGKKHDLFSDERTKQVDTLLTEFKGEAVEKLKQCSDAACLVEVATSIARRLNSGNPSVARAVELTPQKVGEKRTIVETAKSIGVDIEACRTMDPDTASVELLRSCARLAKHENVQKYIPQETKIVQKKQMRRLLSRKIWRADECHAETTLLKDAGTSVSLHRLKPGPKALPPFRQSVVR